MFLVNSCLGLFSVGLRRDLPLSRSYRAILPSSLTHGYLAHLRILSLTTCVGTWYRWLYNIFRSFSWKHSCIRLRFPKDSSPSQFKLYNVADLLTHHSLCLDLNPIIGSYLLSPSLHQLYSQYRNINLLSIAYAFRPRLRSWLTQGRRTVPWNP